MRVCDKHPDRKAVDAMILEVEEPRYDLCEECRQFVLDWISKAEDPPPKRRGLKSLLTNDAA